MPATFEKLFSPFQLGDVTLRNRIVCAPHGTYYARGGLPTDLQVDYYESLARGGASMIVAGQWAVWPRTTTSPAVNAATDPDAYVGHRRIADAVHRHGAHIVAQLHDSGRQGSSAWHRGALLAPSALPDPVVREIPKELEADEIDDMVRHFGLAARSMKDAGWDGVELLAAQGYGISQFLSPQVNKRTDEYGGDLSGRALLLAKVIDAVRSATGSEFLVGVRINGSDFVESGFDIDEAVQLARQLEDSGAVDYLSVSGASNENFPLWIADMGHPSGLFVSLAASIRSQVSLPLMTSTRIKDPFHAEKILQDDTVDLVGMVRALIADPELPNKARTGRVDQIRPCIGCNQGCIGRVAAGSPMGCTVNPAVGTVGDRATQQDSRRVLVVGGGPAGLQAAVTAAERGHEVTLVEARNRLGGQLALAAKVKSRTELGFIIDYLSSAVSRLGVDVRLGSAATAELVGDLDPDTVILANGSTPLRTGFTSFRASVEAISGHDLPHVMTAHDVLDQDREVGDFVVVLDDDPHGQATTVAEHLAAEGRRVKLICRSTTVGLWAGPANQEFIYQRLLRAGVELLTSTWVDEISDSKLTCFNVYSDRHFDIDGCTAVIVATGNRVRSDLYRDLTGGTTSCPVVRIGDCLAPRKLDHAIWDGYQAARNVR